jgi:hypothetical protein
MPERSAPGERYDSGLARRVVVTDRFGQNLPFERQIGSEIIQIMCYLATGARGTRLVTA